MKPNQVSPEEHEISNSQTSKSLMMTNSQNSQSEMNMLANAKLYFGALLSIFDMLTDLFVIRQYYLTGRTGASIAGLVMVGGNLLMQLILVITINSAKPLEVIIIESLAVLFCIKPGVNAYRVTKMTPAREGQIIDPLMEMNFTKGTELFFESIPTAVLQLTQLLMSSNAPTFFQLSSVATSIFSTAFISSMMTYDEDTSEKFRKGQPFFFGMIKDNIKDRGFTVILMTLYAAAHNFVTSLSISLLLSHPSTEQIPLFFTLSTTALYLIYKSFLCDLLYWAPITEFWIHLTLSIITRIFSKLIVDFTGCMTLRHPFEVGGFTYFTTCILMQFWVWISATTYVSNGTNNFVATSTLYLIIIVNQVVWLASILLLTLVTNRSYLNTFVSLKSGRQTLIDIFTDDDNTENKAFIVNTSPRLWENKIGDEVKAWLASNWSHWEETKPSWFSPTWKAAIEDRFLPHKVIESLGGANRRKSSLGDIVLAEKFNEIRGQR